MRIRLFLLILEKRLIFLKNKEKINQQIDIYIPATVINKQNGLVKIVNSFDSYYHN